MLRFLLLLCLALPFSAFAGVAGTFLYVAGEVNIIAPDGKTRVPMRGDALNEGEILVTGHDGSAQLKMADHGLMAVRPATRFTVDAFVYKGSEDGTERSFITLLKGGFRASMSCGDRPESAIAIRVASSMASADGRVAPRRYSVSPIPTIAALSRMSMVC